MDVKKRGRGAGRGSYIPRGQKKILLDREKGGNYQIGLYWNRVQMGQRILPG